ncbi:acyltransferase [Salmonella enterica subsp. enterica serovar Virchow]|nr:acyltransferase [Salmonella enterica subsp. enterica serovar Virchow]
MLTVLAATLIVGLVWMLPRQLEQTAKTAFATLIFAANFALLKSHDYFQPEAELNPLLHMWSLSVEEQFYLLFPFLVIFGLRTGRRRLYGLVLAISLVSLACAEIGWRHFPQHNFYLLPGRAWELGVGALAALFWLDRPLPKNNAIALAGVIAIIVSIAAFDKTTPFPSFYALLPVMGSVAILLCADRSGVVGRMLASRLFVSIGLISYSLYLWHQPVLALGRVRFGEQPGLAATTAMIAIAFLLAVLSYFWVEKPFRSRYDGAFAPNVFKKTMVAACAAVAVVGLTTDALDGLPQRALLRGVDLAAAQKRMGNNHGLDRSCDPVSTPTPQCSWGTDPRVVLWGDSFAMHIAGALAASPTNRSFVQLTRSACAPIRGLALFRDAIGAEKDAAECLDFSDQVLDWVVKNDRIETVILSSSLDLVNGDILTRGGRQAWSEATAGAARAGLADTIGRLKAAGKAVVIVSPTPRNGLNLGDCILRNLFNGGPEETCDFPFASQPPRYAAMWTLLASVPAPTVWLNDLICPQGQCDTVQDGQFIYRDQGHLSVEGSRYIGRKFDLMGQVVRLASAERQALGRPDRTDYKHAGRLSPG